jgi:hypothetical protein
MIEPCEGNLAKSLAQIGLIISLLLGLSSCMLAQMLDAAYYQLQPQQPISPSDIVLPLPPVLTRADSMGLRLFEASKAGDLATVQMLVQSGVPINWPNPLMRKQSALFVATYTPQVKVLRYLLQHGAAVDQQDAYGNTALHRAALHDELQAVKILLRYGADPNAENHDGDRPLDLAPDAEYSRTYSAIRARGGRTGRTFGGQFQKLFRP